MNCTRCKSANKVKRGIVKEGQRYTCKNCGYNYTIEKNSNKNLLSNLKNIRFAGIMSTERILSP